jgi:hypothetical protein
VVVFDISISIPASIHSHTNNITQQQKRPQPCTESQTSSPPPQQNIHQPWLWSNTTPTRQLTSHELQHPPPAIPIQVPTRTDLPRQLPVDPPAAATTLSAALAAPAARTRTPRHELSARLRARDMRLVKRRMTTFTMKACGKSGIARLWMVLAGA